MAARRTLIGSTVVALAVGCSSVAPMTAKPPMVEEYSVPPNEARFSKPHDYPEETLNKAPKKSNIDDPNGPPPVASKMNGGGMGGMGGAGSR